MEQDDRDPRDPESWYQTAGVCGSCIAWRPGETSERDEVATGACRLRPELGRVPASLKLCDLYKPRGSFVYRPAPQRSAKRKSGPTRVLRRDGAGGLVEAPAPKPRPALLEERPPPPREIDLGTDSVPLVRDALVEMIRDELGRSRREMAQKYKQGGRVDVVDGEGNTRASIPATRFFSFLDRLRSSLDQLENAVSESEGLGDRSELVESVRRVHGSFTTFNVMFADREDYFSGKG